MKWIKPLQSFTIMLRILNSKDYEQERISRSEEVKTTTHIDSSQQILKNYSRSQVHGVIFSLPIY